MSRIEMMLLACAFMLSASALTDLPSTYDASTGFDTQKEKDVWSSTAGSFFNSGDDPAVANAKWTSGYSMHSGTNYYADKFVYAYPSTHSKIPGTASELYVLANTLEIRGTYDLTCSRRFIALPGATMRFMQAGRTFSSTALEVRSTAASPFTICMRCSSVKATSAALTFPIEGPSTAALYLPYTYAGGTDRVPAHTYNYRGDASAYQGTILVDGLYTTNICGYLTLALGTANLGGSIVLTNRANLVKYDSKTPTLKGLSVSGDSCLSQDAAAWTIGDLSFANGGKVLYTVTRPGVIMVTNSLTHGTSPVILDFNNQQVYSWSVDDSINKKAIPTNELFRFAADITVSTNDFRVENITRAIGGYLPVPILITADNVDGTKSLCLTHRPVIAALNSMNLNADDEANAWSDGLRAHPDADYLMSWISATQSKTGKAMETAMYAQTWNKGNNVFGGGSLTISGGILWPLASDCKIDHLVLKDGSQISKNNEVEATMTGNILVTATDDANPVRIHPAKGSIEIASDMSGSASTVVRFYDAGAVTLSGDNSVYSGRLRFEGATTYSFADGNDLGGGNSVFLYNAIDLNGVSAVLKATDDADLSNVNRGLLVRKTATVSVEANKTLSVAAPVTFANVLTKAGAGTLAFAAAPRFIDGGETTAPLAGTNGLNITAGAVEVAHAKALNGLALTVASTAALVIDDKAGDLHNLGAVMTRWPNPLSASATVPVRLKLAIDKQNGPSSYQRGVMTFATRAEAETALSKLRVTTSPRGYGAALAVVENTLDEQTVYTVRATCDRNGLVVIFK